MQKIKYFLIPLILGILLYSCEKDDTNVIDPILNFPVIDSVRVSPTVFDTSRININLTAYVTSVDPIGSVVAKITDPDGNDFVSVGLQLNGSAYSSNLDTLLACRVVGNYKIEFVATTVSGLASNTVSNTFDIINSNNVKPSISIIYAPDSIQRPPGSEPVPAAFLKVQGFDPNGDCDVSSAYFNSFNPNGIPSSQNPFLMYDNGNTSLPYSDTIANDKKYSLTIYINNQANLGNYSFRFNAKDRLGLVSDTLTKIIRIY